MVNVKSTEQVAVMFDCDPSGVRRWAGRNGVQFIGNGYHKNYIWTDEDIERFKNRDKPGRRWPEKDQV
jgi:hypothetical protein